MAQVLVNGVPSATVGALDRGLAYGDGVFRTLRVAGRQPIWLLDHLAKLGEDAGRLGIPFDEAAWRGDLAQLALPNYGVLRLTLTRGEGPRGYRPPSPAHPTRLVACWAEPHPPSSSPLEGGREDRGGLPPPLQGEGRGEDGVSFVTLFQDDQPLGRFDLADRLRPEAAAAVARLNALGVRTVMLTGDQEGAAAVIAAQAGIADFRARVRPQDKAAAVSALKADDQVAGMVGDGVNDAPALAAADVSFSLAGGSDIALETADITLMRADLHGLADAVELSRAVMKKIRQNLFFAFFYNILGLPLAAAGLLNPVIAGAAMALSSVSVVSNALTLRRWRPSR